MTRLVERARQAVLAWFNAVGDYTAVFTQNATGALEARRGVLSVARGGSLLLTADNHNSVNGIREFACAGGASIAYAPLSTPELRIDRERLRELLARAHPSAQNLFAYPAQSNFSGVKHPLCRGGRTAHNGSSVNHGDTLSSAGQGPVNARLLWEAGITYGYGTDTSWHPRETLADELRALQLTFSAKDIITILTKNAAISAIKGEQLGTLETGKAADIVIVNGDPLTDVTSLLNVTTVIKGGDVVVDKR